MKPDKEMLQVLRRCKAFLPHFVLAMGFLFMLLLVLNRLNPMMSFLDSSTTIVFLFLFSLGAFLQSVLEIRDQRRAARQSAEQRETEKTDRKC